MFFDGELCQFIPGIIAVIMMPLGIVKLSVLIIFCEMEIIIKRYL